ncbi:hypothetical protein HOP50_10g58840 [Chloropicon primus]|uniref:Uncharacterized protein n=2 Tax=Chloropicon primus TaxID=1764295 RepID=A0A5B8MSA8_9CHLO|nr:hypothetical protein A3770_10p58640 [Chloropicon primus]UPR02558.1 hypothetical protein HOP50_10g58840 [Chloropicon primus]|eukprot:QDZ23346.1 hypothetical protein A3770_10p58640 [Chloropicon primus]
MLRGCAGWRGHRGAVRAGAEGNAGPRRRGLILRPAVYRYSKEDMSPEERGGAGERAASGPASSSSSGTGWEKGSGRAKRPDDGYGGWSGSNGWGEGADYAEESSEGFDADAGGFGYEAEGGSSRDSGTSSGPGRLDLWPLRSEELHDLFPLSGTPGQYSYYWGTWDQAVQRFALSLLITLVATNSSPVLAAGAFTYSAWGPVVRSMTRNLSVKKYPYGGFWEARVLDLEFRRDPSRERGKQRGRWRTNQAEAFAAGGAYRRGRGALTTTEIRVGQEGMADVVVEVPYELSHEMLRQGDPALLVVVSNSPTLSSFKAVRDVFLPETRQWLYDYPFVNRRGFQQIVERVNYSKTTSTTTNGRAAGRW